MRYAEVAVNSPAAHSTFCYAIPEQLDIDTGQAVLVPFGSRLIQGIVIELNDQPSFEETKEIACNISDHPLLSPIQIKLAQWLSEYYSSPLFDAVALMLAPGFGRKLVTYLKPAGAEDDLSSLTPVQRKVLYIVRERGKISIGEVEKTIGKSRARRVVAQLLQRHLIIKSEELGKAKAKAMSLPHLRLIASKADVANEIANLKKSRAHKQAALLEFLSDQTQAIPVNEARRRVNCSRGTIKALENSHLISVELVDIRRDPLAHLSFTPAPLPILTPAQQDARKLIKDVITDSYQLSVSPPVFLLFGVTGSGKTEIYLSALDQVIATGKRGICLIPEIALTLQTVERFARRFPGRVAVLHSGLSLGEQFDEWQWIKEGHCDVVIGPRSALFAPQPDIGLIIIDEEHEWTYKQDDKSPRYHARDAALKMAQLSGSAVILGSATPDIESFHKAQQGKYQLVELNERITSNGPCQVQGRAERASHIHFTYSSLPNVSIVDLKEELKAGNTGLFSRPLLTAMEQTLERNEQTILFLNRRGAATFISCPNCGFVFRCPRCSVALTYHSIERKLICHRCRYSISVPQMCPQCYGQYLRFLGVGTQRVEDEVNRLFPQARLLRWDKDVVTKRYAHEELLRSFREHEVDILIGTQMIAKGLDLPQVTLAGIISADIGLNFPDFRAGERTFQLLCQVAGRAGRGVKAGNVIIQTYSPENYAIKAAAKHDYVGFYNQEINYRRQYNYPPYSKLIRLTYTHTNDDLCRRTAERMGQIIRSEGDKKGMDDLSLIGPVPGFTSRVRGRYRWQVILRGSNPARALSDITLSHGWVVDVDPVGII